MESAHHFSSRPDCNNNADVLLSLCALLFLQSHYCLICVALTYNDSRIIPRKTCQIPRHCQCKWLLVSSSAARTSSRSSGSPGKTGMIVSTELPNLVPPRHIDDCYAIHFLHWVLCDPQLLSHQHFPLWARLYQHVFWKKHTKFVHSSRYRFLGPSESACRDHAYPNPVPLFLAAPLVIHEKNWKYLDPQAQGFPKALKDYFHQPHFLWNPAASPAIHAIYRFVLLRVLHFYLCFRVLWVYAAVSP